MSNRFNDREFVETEFVKYKKSAKKASKNETNNLSKDNEIVVLQKRVEDLEMKLVAMIKLYESHTKSFDDFLAALRKSQLQDVRAKEKAYNMIGSNLQGGLKMFMDESRRSALQMVSYSSRKIGMDYKSTKYKYGEKSYNVGK